MLISMYMHMLQSLRTPERRKAAYPEDQNEGENLRKMREATGK